MDHALAAAALGLPVFPLAPLSKKPLLKGVDWKQIATTDENQILAWWRDAPGANYGVATGSKADLLVIDIDSAEGESWWRGHGFTGRDVLTPSGGRHVYFRTENADIQTNAKKIHDGVDVRAAGGYVVGPGSMLPTGTYRGTLDSIPDAPAELIALLPERQTYQSEQFEGEQVEVASVSEQRQINAAIKDLEGIARVWAPGVGWHDTVFRVACWLSRMVNSAAYAMTEDAAITILLTHAPTYPEWDESNIITEWVDARKRTIGQYADTPVEAIPDLLPLMETMALLPETTSKGLSFTSLLFDLPDHPTPSKLLDQRHTLIVEAFRAGLTDAQVATLAWSAKVTEQAKLEPGAQQKIWREVEQGHLESMKPSAVVAVAEPVAQVFGRRVTLLTPEERKHRASGKFTWFGDTYMNWAESTATVMNEPYHRMNRWTIMALVYGPLGVIALEGGIDIGLNLYQMILGETTTGKSQSVKLMRSVLKAYFPVDDKPDIGGDATPIALYERLIERDGKVSLFRKDEAHGKIYEMKNTGYMKEMPTALTELFDGEVPTFLRAGRKDQSGQDATTIFNIHFMGTMGGMTEVLEGPDWESGFLNRFAWAVGDKHERTRDTMGMKFRNPNEQAASNVMQAQWAAEFRSNERILKRADGRPNEMTITPEIHERWLDMKAHLLLDVAAGHKHDSRLTPTFERFATTVLKCACLVALSQRSTVVEMDHLLVAIEQAEEWVNNIVMMVERTDETPFIRDVNAIERLIAGQPGHEMQITNVYKMSPREKTKDTDELIRKLTSEGRVLEFPQMDGSKLLRINPKQKEAA